MCEHVLYEDVDQRTKLGSRQRNGMGVTVDDDRRRPSPAGWLIAAVVSGLVASGADSVAGLADASIVDGEVVVGSRLVPLT